MSRARAKVHPYILAETENRFFFPFFNKFAPRKRGARTRARETGREISASGRRSLSPRRFADLSRRLRNYLRVSALIRSPQSVFLISPFYTIPVTPAKIKWVRAAICGSIDFNALGRPRRTALDCFQPGHSGDVVSLVT